MENFLYTETGMLKIRWWIPAAAIWTLALYLGYNIIVAAAVMGGASGAADPFWNAPIYWVFGK